MASSTLRFPPLSKPPKPARLATAKFLFRQSATLFASVQKNGENRPFEVVTKPPLRITPAMKKLLLALALIAITCCGIHSSFAADAPKPDDRLTDLEAYVTNGSGQTNSVTALTNMPGPGHNAFQMIC